MVSDRSITPPTVRTALLISLAAVILAIPAVFNGYPLVYPDTPAYVGMAVQGWKDWARSLYYSYLIFPFHAGKTLWPVVFFQGAVIAHIILLVIRQTVGRTGTWTYLGTITLLAAFTSLPWFTSYIMADAFTSVVILTTFLIGFVSEGLSKREKIYLWAVLALSISTHQSHIPLALGLTATILISKSLSAKGLWSGISSTLPLSSALVIAMAANSAANVKYHGWERVTGYGQIFAIARFIEDGPAYEYLRDHCRGEEPYILCQHLEEMPLRSGQFLWGEESLLGKAGGADAIAEEASEIVIGSVISRPTEHLKNATRLTFTLLSHPRTGVPQGEPLGSWLPKLALLMPGDQAALNNSRQRKGSLPFYRLNQIHRPLSVLALLVSLALLVPLKMEADKRPFWLTFTILTGMIGNAFISATVSGPVPRLHGRAAWLATFSCSTALIWWIEKGRRTNMPPTQVIERSTL